MNWKNPKIARFLIISSCILLSGFLGFWLTREYQYEKEALKKELNQIFNEAVWDIRDSIRDKTYYIVLRENGKSHVHPIRSQKELHKNSKSIDSIIEASRFKYGISQDSQIQTRIIRSRRHSLQEKYPDSIVANTLVNLTIESEESHENDTNEVGGYIFNLALTKIRSNLKKENLPVDVNLVEISNRDSAALTYNSSILTRERKLLGYERKGIAAVFSNYNSSIFKRMLGSVFLALIVLSCTILTLIFIYRSLRKQQQLTNIKNDLISNIAHELKTPITTVGVALEAMSNFNALDDNEKTEEYIDISRNEVQRLGILVDKVINTAVFEKSELELKPEVFDIELLIFDIIKSMTVQFDKFSAKIEFENIAKETDILADKIHLTNVIINLIDNAIKYSKEEPHIIIKLANRGKDFVLNIIDHGIGIGPEYKDKIFDKFFRVPQGDTHNVKGHGLGLNYVYNVVKRHKGSIRVDSNPGTGTNFLISLPDAYE